jgi:hypothetical protein
MDKTFDLFAKEEKFKDIDFLFPTLTKDKTGFIPRPASNAQIMATIREALTSMVSDDLTWDMTDKDGKRIRISAKEAIKRFTMSACRVFISEWSHLADLPLELRRWLGRWKESSMANTYTRAHRGKILHIMDRLKGKEHLVEVTGGAPEDIAHSYYLSEEQNIVDEALDDDSAMPGTTPHDVNPWELVPNTCRSPSQSESPKKLAKRNTFDSLHNDNFGDYHESAEQFAEGLIEDELWYDTRQKLIQSTHGLKFPSSQLPQHLDGPLSLIRTKHPTGKDHTKKFHLALTTRITVGCGMDATKCDIITGDEMIPLHASLSVVPVNLDKRLCALCFKFFYWDLADKDRLTESPLEIETSLPLENTGQSDSDSMASVSDASVPSNDSDSETEALRPPGLT